MVASRPRLLQPVIYAGQPVECVPKFRYVGVWFHQSGLVSDSFADTLSASRRALYACEGRLARVGPAPVCLKITFCDAFVRPVMMYCAKALTNTKGQTAALDNLQLQHFRWALGRLAKNSSCVDILA